MIPSSLFGPPSTTTIAASSSFLPSRSAASSLDGKTTADLMHEIHTRLVDQLKLEEVNRLPEDRRRSELRWVIDRLIDSMDNPVLLQNREQVAEEVLDEVLGLGPLEKLLRDPTVNDILINNAHEVFIERRGKLEESSVHFRDDKHLLQIIDRIVSRVGRRCDETSPMVDARLADGSRFNAIIPPLALRGPSVSIRRFGVNPLKLADLLRYQALTPEIAQLMEACVKARLNMIISGGTGSGKTTLLNILSAFISHTDRIVTVEDAAELQLQQRHVVQLEARPANIEGRGAVTIRDLVRNCLRMRPDRIVVGECRGAEALDMLQAMNTGHEGSLTTLHANSPRDTLSRLETMIMLAGFDLPIKAMRQQISSAVNVIIQTSRLQGGARKVINFTEVAGMEGDVIILQDIFVYQQLGLDEDGRATGRFEATGVRPRFAGRIKAAGIDLPPSLFQERVLETS